MGSGSSFCPDDHCLRSLVLRGCLLNGRQLLPWDYFRFARQPEAVPRSRLLAPNRSLQGTIAARTAFFVCCVCNTSMLQWQHGGIHERNPGSALP